MRRILTFIFSLSLLATTVMAQDIDRSNWTVTTETDGDYGYVSDAGTGQPESMFDGDKGTYWCVVKPGRTLNSQFGGLTPPSFVVDLKSTQTFDYLRWSHRYGSAPTGTSNTYNYLRVFGIDILGSNNGVEFTKINNPTEPDAIIWIPNVAGYVGSVSSADSNYYKISIPESSYRYVKVTVRMWANIYHSQHPDHPGDGYDAATGGNSVQISEFGLGKSNTAVETITTSGAKIYPTLLKAGQEFTVSLEGDSSAEVSIYTISGVKLSEKKITGSSPVQSIDRKGVYIVEVKKSSGNYISKIVVN